MFLTGSYQLLKNRWLVAAAVLSLFPLTTLHAQDEKQVNIGLLKSTSPRLEAQDVEAKAEPSHRFDLADHVANGIAMRNRTSGTIHLRGIPIRSTPLRALLYFNFSDGNEKGADSTPVLFNGNVLTAKKTGDHADPCWGMVGSHSYVADATAFLPNGGNLNQDFHVVLPFQEDTSTTGQNPWSPNESQRRRMQGATLVVVYQGTGAVYVYDALNNAMFSQYCGHILGCLLINDAVIAKGFVLWTGFVQTLPIG